MDERGEIKDKKLIKKMEYQEFLENKIVVAESFGFEVNKDTLSNKLFPHQKEIIIWALEGGRRAVSVELNPEYYDDGLFYLKSIEYKINTPQLFDLISV